MATDALASTSCSGTVPARYGLGGLGSTEERGHDAYVTLEGSSGTLAQNAARLAALRSRMPAVNKSLPSRMVQNEIINEVVSVSSSEGPPPPDDDSDSGPESPGTERQQTRPFAGAARTAVRQASHRAREMEVHRTVFEEIAVGVDALSQDRWYPQALGGVVQGAAEVVNYTQLRRSRSISRLARVYEHTTALDQDAGAPVPRRANRRPDDRDRATIKQALLSKAPWRRQDTTDYPYPESPVAVDVTPTDPEPPSTTETYVDIDLSYRNMQPDAPTIESLCHSIVHSPHLTHLDLSFNPAIGDIGFLALSETILTHPALEYVNLSGCCLGDNSALRIAEHLGTTAIKRFDLMWNGITDTGAWLLKKHIGRGGWTTGVVEINLLPPEPARQKLHFRIERPVEIHHVGLDHTTTSYKPEPLGLAINAAAMIVQFTDEDGPAAHAQLLDEVLPDSGDPQRLLPGMVVHKVEVDTFNGHKRLLETVPIPFTNKNEYKVRCDDDLQAALSDLRTTHESQSITLQVRSNRVSKKLAGRINEKLKKLQGQDGAGDEDEEQEEWEEA
eukprot:TRINITY_DN11207_c1_g2_i1.p1 TRINITY_DN11207_c1_g2~~TRINITY_DN11207_c1_g2_i1.p1  ORF type:complete len:575 (+),score=195.82 TRINITY_DN11207_c1_g2_i1:49-1725(+)